MRILGFSKKWDKLNNKEFTTFRFPRKDKDWQIGEGVQVFYKPRSKEKCFLGLAKIIAVDTRWILSWWSGKWGITEEEAQADGFQDRYDMKHWLDKIYGIRHCYNPMNKLTLRWIKPSIKGD